MLAAGEDLRVGNSFRDALLLFPKLSHAWSARADTRVGFCHCTGKEGALQHTFLDLPLPGRPRNVLGEMSSLPQPLALAGDEN